MDDVHTQKHRRRVRDILFVDQKFYQMMSHLRLRKLTIEYNIVTSFWIWNWNISDSENFPMIKFLLVERLKVKHSYCRILVCSWILTFTIIILIVTSLHWNWCYQLLTCTNSHCSLKTTKHLVLITIRTKERTMLGLTQFW